MGNSLFWFFSGFGVVALLLSLSRSLSLSLSLSLSPSPSPSPSLPLPLCTILYKGRREAGKASQWMAQDVCDAS